MSNDDILQALKGVIDPELGINCMIAGYVWLGAAGIAALLVPPGAAAFSRDAAVHAIAIGFVLSMVFGHAPIILQAVTGIRVRYSAALYVALALLHVSVLLRVSSDLGEAVALRAASGVVTVVALASYAGTLIWSSWRRAAAQAA
jgi:hypothetical protein